MDARATLVVLCAGAALPIAAASGTSDDRFGAARERGLVACEAIPASEYSSGLIFNAPGHATMFHRSRCFQKLAVDERDGSLCAEVRERKSLLFDGSGISERRCRELVAKRIEQDTREADAKDFRTIHRLKSLRFFRNGNGKDFDLVVETTGSRGGPYELLVTASASGGGAQVTIHEKSYPYGGQAVPRWIFLRRNELEQSLGSRFQDAELTVVVTLRFAKTTYNRFYYDGIAPELTTSRLETTVKFAGLRRQLLPTSQ